MDEALKAKEIGARIEKSRKLAGITQKELAKRIGTHFQVISNYERGARKPKIETLGKIASALGVSLESLSGIQPNFSVEDLRAALIQAIKTPEKQGEKLFWNDDGPTSICPVCGYECDDPYYIENFCTKCGTRLYSIYDPDVEVEE